MGDSEIEEERVRGSSLKESLTQNLLSMTGFSVIFEQRQAEKARKMPNE